MNASEARIKATLVNQAREDAQYDDVKTFIDEKVSNGKYELIYDRLYPEVTKRLENEGFEIRETHNQHDGYTTYITW